MSTLVALSFRRRRMTLALMALLLLAGVMAYANLPKQGQPDLDIPALFVTTTLPGASPEEADALLVRPIEARLRGIVGLSRITSTASAGTARVVLEFRDGWDRTATLADLRDRMARAQADLPAEASQITIEAINLSELPVLVVGISGDVAEGALRELARQLQTLLEALHEVQAVRPVGLRDRAFDIIVAPETLAARGLSPDEIAPHVARALQAQPLGQIEAVHGSASLRISEDSTAATLGALPIRAEGGAVLRLGDVAVLRQGLAEPVLRVWQNGAPAILLEIVKTPGADASRTARAAGAVIADARASWPADIRALVQIETGLDESARTAETVAQLEGAVATAVALVLAVVLIALGLRAALLVGLAVPVSFLMAFAGFGLAGIAISNMVMFGLILAVGMLVDSAIVVTEEAETRMAGGEAPDAAFAGAAARLFWPVTAATGTTLCVFLPMLFWPGVTGAFMSGLPITLIFVLGASLMAALVFLPALGGLVARKRAPRPAVHAAPKPGTYARLILPLIARPLPALGTAGGIGAAVVAVFMLYGQHNHGTEFFTEVEPERIVVHVRARGDLALEERAAMVAAVAARLQSVEGIGQVFSLAGEGGLTTLDGAPRDGVGRLHVELARWGTRPAGRDVVRAVEAATTGVPGAIVEVVAEDGGPGAGKPVHLRLQAENRQELESAARIVAARMAGDARLRDLDDTLPLPGIDWAITPHGEVLARTGANRAAVAGMVRLATGGVVLHHIRLPGEDRETEIRLRLPSAHRSIDALAALPMATPAGTLPLASLARIEPVAAEGPVLRIDGRRAVELRAALSKGTQAADIVADFSEWLARDTTLPAGVTWTWAGEQEDQDESAQFLMVAFAAALGLMFLILLALFNSFYNSALVLLAVVLSVAGVLAGKLLMGIPFSILMSGTGVLALAGLIVNHNIVLIDAVHERARTLPPIEAIAAAAASRLRPILLTTATTVAGLLPMMLGLSFDLGTLAFSLDAPAALMWKPLATAIVFGLVLATPLTLILTPALLALRVHAAKGWRRLRANGGVPVAA